MKIQKSGIISLVTFKTNNSNILNPIQISASFGLSKFDIYSIIACFENKKLFIYEKGNEFFIQDELGITENIGDNTYWYPSKNIEEFVNAFKKKSIPPTTLKDAYISFILADSLTKSLSESKTLRISFDL